MVTSRVIYDRVRNRKNYFEFPAFLPIERGISRVGKFKVMLHFAATEMCLFVFLFSFEFPALEVPHSKFKKAAISKSFFLFSTLSYIILSKTNEVDFKDGNILELKEGQIVVYFYRFA